MTVQLATKNLAWVAAFAWLWVGAAIAAQQFSLGPVRTVPNPRPGVPEYWLYPDGHIALLPDGEDIQMYWAGSTTYRTLGRSIFSIGEPRAVLKAGPRGSFDNGGAWLYSVFRQDKDQLIGFYHAEDQEFTANPASHFIAWRSVVLCDSADNGKNWRKQGQIITSSRQKPDQPTWGGCGDFCVVRDEKQQRWVCFYAEHYLYMAASSDRNAAPGSWKKYFDRALSEPGLGGRQTPIEGLAGHAGGNPSVHFNSFLGKWVMVWETWDQGSPSPDSIWLSTSDDLQRWTSPKVVVPARGRERHSYPTILGNSDVSAGEKAWLCYASFSDKAKSERQFVAREITWRMEN
jgi:hypothetical protein